MNGPWIYRRQPNFCICPRKASGRRLNQGRLRGLNRASVGYFWNRILLNTSAPFILILQGMCRSVAVTIRRLTYVTLQTR